MNSKGKCIPLTETEKIEKRESDRNPKEKNLSRFQDSLRGFLMEIEG
jgi:hypothetical protein